MSNQVLNAPKLLAPGDGSSFQFFNLFFTEKVNEANTHGEWVMHEILGHAGEGAPLHSHPWRETFYVLDGELDVQVGDRAGRAIPGSLMHVPEHVAHSFCIVSPSVRLLEIIPADAAGFYRESGERVPTLPPDLVAFQEISEKYGVRLF